MPTRIRYLSWVCKKGWATGREGEKESWMEKGVGVVLGEVVRSLLHQWVPVSRE